MSNLSRRKLITTGLAAAAGASGLAVAARLADRYGLIPPDHGGIYGARQNPDLRFPAAADAPLAGPRIPSQPDFEGSVRKRQAAPRTKPSSACRPEGSRTGGSPSTAWSPAPHRSRLPNSRAFPPAARSLSWPAKRAGRLSPSGSACRLSHVLNVAGAPPASQICCLLFDPARLVGQHRHGRCIASADSPDLRDERRRTSRGPRRSASPAGPPPARLQEREVHHPPDRHRQSERVRQGPGLRVSRRRLCLVRRHLTVQLETRKSSATTDRNVTALLPRYARPAPLPFS